MSCGPRLSIRDVTRSQSKDAARASAPRAAISVVVFRKAMRSHDHQLRPIPPHKLPLLNHLDPQRLRLRQLAPRLFARHEQAGVLAHAARRLAAEGADALFDRLA